MICNLSTKVRVSQLPQQQKRSMNNLCFHGAETMSRIRCFLPISSSLVTALSSPSSFQIWILMLVQLFAMVMHSAVSTTVKVERSLPYHHWQRLKLPCKLRAWRSLFYNHFLPHCRCRQESISHQILFNSPYLQKVPAWKT